MDLDITFDGKTMCTPVYIKMDAQDQLLLAEGVCRQLGIVSYHPEVETWRGGSKGRDNRSDKTVTVPSVRVNITGTHATENVPVIHCLRSRVLCLGGFSSITCLQCRLSRIRTTG